MNRRLLIGGGIVIVLLIALIAVLATRDDDTPSEAAVTTTASTTTSTVTTAAPPPQPTTTTVAPSTTTTTAPASTTSTTGDPALPDTTGDDFDKILRELIDYHNWAHQNPAEAEPTAYLDPACECFDQVADRLIEWAQNGWRETDEGIVVREVLVLFEAANSTRIRMIDEHVPLTVVDGEGAVVETREARGPTRNSVTLVRNATDTGWVINEWIIQGSVGG